MSRFIFNMFKRNVLIKQWKTDDNRDGRITTMSDFGEQEEGIWINALLLTFIECLCIEYGSTASSTYTEYMLLLTAYFWPHNLRSGRNYIELGCRIQSFLSYCIDYTVSVSTWI